MKLQQDPSHCHEVAGFLQDLKAAIGSCGDFVSHQSKYALYLVLLLTNAVIIAFLHFLLIKDASLTM